MGHDIKFAEINGLSNLRLPSYQSNRRLNKELYIELDALKAYGEHSGRGMQLDIEEKNIDSALIYFKQPEIVQFLKDAKLICVNGYVKIYFG